MAVTTTMGYNAESLRSGISWPAIIGGAFAAAAVSIMLLSLGSGLGFNAASGPHGDSPVSSFTMKAAAWLIITQWVASAVGGYIAGRLRTKWADLHAHEVFFRDTAHGFLVWSVATVITALLFMSAAFGLAKGAMHMAGMASAGAGMGAGAAASAPGHNEPGPGGPMTYYVDSLFRSDHPAPNASDADVRAETMRIVVNGIKAGDVPAGDKAYLAQVVSQRTGLSQPDAAKRVDDVIAQVKADEEKARQHAEEARKTGEKVSFFVFFSLLIGAFVACVSATLGGMRRDAHN